MRKIKKRKNKMAGSFTIEAAFLMPVFINIILFILYLGFYCYNTAVCSQACYAGSRLLAYEEDRTAFEKEKKQLQEQVIGLDGLNMYENEEGDRIDVIVEARMKIPIMGWELSIYEKHSVYELDQRKLIMRYASLFRRLVGSDDE